MSKTLPFRFRNIVWTRHVEGSYALVGITQQWNVIKCGDTISRIGPIESVSRPLSQLAEAASKRTLFQDIFGKSAFEVIETQIEGSTRLYQRKDGRKALSVIDTPAYSAPPLDAVYSSLMESLLEQYVEPEPDADETLVEDEMDESHMDVDAAIPSLQARIVDDKELEDLTSLFRKQSVSVKGEHASVTSLFCFLTDTNLLRYPENKCQSQWPNKRNT